jgi:hypothetical protein
VSRTFSPYAARCSLFGEPPNLALLGSTWFNCRYNVTTVEFGIFMPFGIDSIGARGDRLVQDEAVLAGDDGETPESEYCAVQKSNTCVVEIACFHMIELGILRLIRRTITWPRSEYVIQKKTEPGETVGALQTKESYTLKYI